jgi:uncharacterized protein with NRDE domain
MCIASLAIGHPQFPFVLATNRDEWLDRSSTPMHWWHDTEITSGDVLAGQDNVAGGTWLGFNRQGRFALVTNVRSHIENDTQVFAKSRGRLCTSWLNTQVSIEHFKQSLGHNLSHYNGFNLIVGDLKERAFFYLSNRLNDVEQFTCTELSNKACTYGLSNAHLDTPWPKTQALKLATEQALDRASLMSQDLNAALLSEHCFEASPLSAVNVNAENFRGSGKTYGRRCTTVAFLSNQGVLTVIETQRDGSVSEFKFSI